METTKVAVDSLNMIADPDWRKAIKEARKLIRKGVDPEIALCRAARPWGFFTLTLAHYVQQSNEDYGLKRFILLRDGSLTNGTLTAEELAVLAQGGCP